MRSVPLSDNLADRSTQGGGRSEEAAIHSEIAVRLLELKELVGADKAIRFIQKLSVIWHLEPAAAWVVIRIYTGDLSQVTMSYSELGKEAARTKQAAQQEMERALVCIRRHYPELATALIRIKAVSAQLKDEQAQGQTR